MAAVETAAQARPRKTRELETWMLDSTRWNGFEFRSDDVVIGTWSKAGTTWMQQIVLQLLHPEGTHALDTVAWVDTRIESRDYVLGRLRAQASPRVMKTHLPVDALVFSPRAKYIYVGRDGRDVLMSWYHHHASLSPAVYAALARAPGLGAPLGPPAPDVRAYFHEWLDRDGYPVGPFWAHVRSWWDIRDLDNVLLVHFAALKRDLAGEMRRVAAFLGARVREDLWPAVVERCTFDYMRRNSALPRVLAAGVTGGAHGFFHKGTNGRWRDVLTADDAAKYERVAAANLAPDCAHWLATGDGFACAS